MTLNNWIILTPALPVGATTTLEAMSYLNGYADREYAEELPRYRLPMSGGTGTYRAFDVSDDAMPPVRANATVVARYVEQWSQLLPGTPCVVVHKAAIVFRRVTWQNGVLLLRSDHPAYAPEDLPCADVLEVWEAKSYIGPYPVGPPTIEQLAAMVEDLKQQTKKLTA